MSNEVKRYRWMMAGSMLGMLGVYAGQSMMHQARKDKKPSRKVSATASRMTRDAGDFISAVGEAMLNRVK